MHKKIILSIIVACLMFVNVNLKAHAQEINFAQVGDIHYTYKDIYMDRFMYFLSLSLKKKNPDFVVFLGDNVNKSREDNVIGFMRSIHSITIPYYLVFGDTDAHRLSGIEKETYLDIVTTFNKNQKEGQKYYYFKPNNDLICVILDSSTDFAPSKHGEISDEQTSWLDALLTKYPKKLFIIFQHNPIVPPKEDYELSMLNQEKYVSMLRKHSNVIIISSGHYHLDSLIEDKTGIRHISAPAFKDMPHSYQLIKVIYDKDNYKSPKDVQVIVEKVKV